MYVLGRNGSPHRARCHDRQGDLDPRGAERHRQPRHQLLAERRRQGQAAAVLDQQLPAGDRRATGKSILTFGNDGTVDLRVGLRAAKDGLETTTAPARSGRTSLILGSTTGEAFIAPPGDIRAYDVVTGKMAGSSTRFRSPASSATTPGRRRPTSTSAAPTTGARSRSTRSAASSTCRPDRRPTTSTAPIARRRTSSRNCLLALDARTGKRLWHFQTVHHDLWDFDNVVGAAARDRPPQRPDASTPSRSPARPASSTSSTASRVSRSGRSRNGRCRRATCPASRPGRRSRFRPSPRRSRGSASPWTTSTRGCARRSNTGDEERVAKARNEGLFTPPALIDTSRCPATRAERTGGRRPRIRRRGWCSSSNVNQVAILRLEDVKTRTACRSGGAACRGRCRPVLAYQQYCSVSRGQPAGRRAGGGVARRRHRSHGRGRDQGDRHRRRGLMRPRVLEHRTEDQTRSSRISPTPSRLGRRRRRAWPRR